MNAKNIFRNIRGLAMSALLLIPAAFVSCSDDDTEGGSPYFRLENTVVSSKLVTASSDLGFDAEAIIGDATLELIRYDIRSNCNWSVECNSTDGDWIKFYPKTGQGDGKVRFCLDDNDANTPRSATVVFLSLIHISMRSPAATSNSGSSAQPTGRPTARAHSPSPTAERYAGAEPEQPTAREYRSYPKPTLTAAAARRTTAAVRQKNPN